MTDRQAPRDEPATATRILARHGLIGMFGHVSVVTDDPEHCPVRPRAGRRKDRCRPEEMHELSPDDQFAPGLPLELRTRAATHRARPGLHSLAHVHSPHRTARAAPAEPPADPLMPHASAWPDHIPRGERSEPVTDHATGNALAARQPGVPLTVRADEVGQTEPCAAVGRHYSVRVVHTGCRS
ncbi:class II aldolase/adducin family protein [Streptomyces sp. NPDC088794]|uniref:class II aldolase/adducin family protein n=1 Tax=Streptomyces sp. NPDC088794 TaxID=3365902 RepID=UPI0038237774